MYLYLTFFILFLSISLCPLPRLLSLSLHVHLCYLSSYYFNMLFLQWLPSFSSLLNNRCQDYIILCVEDTTDWKHATTRYQSMLQQQTVVIMPTDDSKNDTGIFSYDPSYTYDTPFSTSFPMCCYHFLLWIQQTKKVFLSFFHPQFNFFFPVMS